jgi:hypothetical protein
MYYGGSRRPPAPKALRSKMPTNGCELRKQRLKIRLARRRPALARRMCVGLRAIGYRSLSRPANAAAVSPDRSNSDTETAAAACAVSAAASAGDEHLRSEP